MYKVALVQNQSEMAHYGYADARPLIEDLGYSPELYTADNIDLLASELSRDQYSAIVIASNAINDKTIKEELTGSKFIEAFHKWLSLDEKRGCLCLHQLRLAASEDAFLGFLPSPLNEVKAKVRPKDETSANGSFSYSTRSENHELLLYPNEINPHNLQQKSQSFKSLPGLYWHYWDNVNLSDWEILISDSTIESERALVISSRDLNSGRIVLSAITLDWQKHIDIFKNILTFVVEGKHNTAILTNDDNKNTAFEYFIGTLKSRRYPFRKYSLTQNLSELERHVKNGVHTVIILDSFVSPSKLPNNIQKLIQSGVSKGNLKLIDIDHSDSELSMRRFSVSGRERSAISILNTTELKIQGEIKNGYVDGSFWSTAETLQILSELPQSTSNYNSLISKALDFSKEHDRNGSYDEVFGVTCAYLWLKAKRSDVNLSSVSETTEWIRSRISSYENREQIQAYLVFDSLSIITAEESNALSKILLDAQPSLLNEIDLIFYLRAAITTQEYSTTISLINKLEEAQEDNGAWVDLATTATTISTLINLLGCTEEQSISSQIKNRVETMIFKGIIYIQNNMNFSPSVGSQQHYPWDGKASTTVKCIQAWLKFEDLVDLPVNELFASISKYNVWNNAMKDGQRALGVLDLVKKDNIELAFKLAEVEGENISNRKVAHKSRFFLFALVIAVYVILTLFYGLIERGVYWDILKIVFKDTWELHLTAIGVAVASLTVPWKKVLSVINKDNTDD